MSSNNLSIELTAPNGKKYTQPIGLFINNEFVKSKAGEKITSINPTDESEIASVYAAGAEDVDIAVDAARKAFKTWRDIVPTERGGLMLKLADLGTLSPVPTSLQSLFSASSCSTSAARPTTLTRSVSTSRCPLRDPCHNRNMG